MSFPRLATVTTAAVAGALAFYVITESGVGGTVFGAALWSAVYSVFSHFAGSGLERGEAILRSRRAAECAAAEACEAAETESAETEPDPGSEADLGLSGHAALNGEAVRRAVYRWAPASLSVVALVVSGFIAFGTEPVERLVVTERVVEQPVVTERVVVEERPTTVTVTVPVYRSAPSASPSQSPAPASPAAGAPTSEAPSTTSTTAPPTTATTQPPATEPPTTVSTEPAPPPTTEAP